MNTEKPKLQLYQAPHTPPIRVQFVIRPLGSLQSLLPRYLPANQSVWAPMQLICRRVHTFATIHNIKHLLLPMQLGFDDSVVEGIST
jgi:hypothetical protein